LVKAATQAQMIKACQEALTEEELAIYKRGRNAKSYTMAKNATMQDYRMATGFECLMGYLYMTGQMDRMITLIQAGLKSIDEA
jgi:ribonuclease-3 family protein